MAFSDRELLARTLQAEAGNQGPAGMLAAGSVIMNRTKTQGYGDGLQGVIMKPGQFSVWNGVTGYAGGEQGQDMAAMAPSGSAYAAADTLIGGQYNDPTGGATHYYNPSISQPSWGIDNGGDWTRIGDHVFGNADAASGTQARNNVGQEIANDTMRALERQPAERSAPTRGILSNEGDQMDRQQPQGLLGSLGIQRRDPNAQGETAQPFYNRQSFGDTLARLAPALGRMGVMGLEGPAQAALDTRNQRQGEERARREKDAQTNQSLQYLKELGRDDLVAAVQGGLSIGDAIAIAIKPAEEYSPNSGIAKLQQDLQNGAITQEQFDLGLANMAPSGMSLTVGADGSINLTEGPGAGSSGTMTEGQSKDAVYATRAEGALKVLDPVANILTNAGMGAANMDPTGIIRGSVQSPEYQMAAQAGQEFLQAILRKDTGAAITPSEEDSYGQVYLPRPGDGEEVLAQKQLSRRRALEALKAGLSPTAILAQEQALANTNLDGGTPPPAGGSADISGMSDAQLQAIVEGGQ